MSKLPSGWVASTLGDSLEVLMDHRGKTPGKLGGDFVDSGVPAISAMHIKDGRVDFSRRERFVTFEMFERWMPERLRQGDVLMTSEAPLGSLAFVPADDPLVLSQRLFALRGRHGYLDNRYLRWFLESPLARHQLDERSSGSTVTGIRQAELRQLTVPIPPLDEQCRIVDLLEEHLSRLDAAVDSLRRSLRRADAMVVSSLAAQVTGRRECWSSSTVGAQAEVVQYGSGAKCDARATETDVPVLRMGNVKDGALVWGSLKYLPADHDDFPKLLLQPGDLLFNRTNSAEHVGKSAVFDSDCIASFASYLIRVRFRLEVLPAWANMVINSPMGREYVGSVVSQQVGQANVNGTKLKAFPLPLPTREEQDRRIKEHYEVLESRARLSSAVDAAMSRAVRLRRSLLAAAFSGRLTSAESHVTSTDMIEELANV